MSILTYRGYNARVELDPDDKCFVGHLADVNDVVSFEGSSLKEIKLALKEAINDYLAACKEIGKQPERPTPAK